MNPKQLKYWNKGFKTAFVIASIIYGIAIIIILQSFSNKLETLIKTISEI